MPEAPKARSAPRGGLRVRIGVVLGLAALQALGGRQLRRPTGRYRSIQLTNRKRRSVAVTRPLNIAVLDHTIVGKHVMRA